MSQSPFAALPHAAAPSTAERDPKTLLFIGYGANGRLKSMPSDSFIQVGFTSAEISLGRTPDDKPAHCVILSRSITDPVERASFQRTMSNLVGLNQERSRGTKPVTAEQMLTYFVRVMQEFNFAVEQYRPLESSEDVRAQIAARQSGTRTPAASPQSQAFDFENVR